MKNFDIVVFDTNVLLHDPYALFAFDAVEIVIPIVVLEELDAIKCEMTEAGHNARVAIRFLEQISKLGVLTDGISLTRAMCKFLVRYEKDFNIFVRVETSRVKELGSDFALEKNDNRIISCCVGLSERSAGVKLSFITRDVNLRIKARVLGIDALDFENNPYDQSDLRGYREESLDSLDLKFLTKENLAKNFDVSNYEANEYLVVKSKDNPYKFKMFRFDGTENCFVDVKHQPRLWGFSPKSVAQAVALDLLLNDDIPLVFLVGPAGTGKTFLTLLAGLEKVVTEKIYNKFFIARPLVALGADIGFVPGDLQEKLFHWMHPFYDNLDYIFREIDERGEHFSIPKRSLNFMQQPQSKRKKYFSDESPALEGSVHETVAALQRKGFVSLEAITHMRGRSLPNQFIFIDEVQNLTPQEVKTIITRAGVGTKIVLSGDPYQIDTGNMDFYNNGLMSALLKMHGDPLVGYLFLDVSERSPLASLAIKKL